MQQKKQKEKQKRAARKGRTRVDPTEALVYAVQRSERDPLTALEKTAKNLDYTTIKSPTTGVVISRSVDVGQTVAASLAAPTLFLIAEDLTKMQVYTSVEAV